MWSGCHSSALQLRNSVGINQGLLGSNPSGITTNKSHMILLTDGVGMSKSFGQGSPCYFRVSLK